MSSPSPKRSVASFDSASVLHAATVSALRRKPFPHLGNPPIAGPIIRAGGHLPWPLLKRMYIRIGASEGIDPAALGAVDLDAVADSFVQPVPRQRHPAVLIGSSNGALTHLAAAMQAPWLPGTVLVPVARKGDPQRPDLALGFGRRVVPPLLAANPGVVVHQMHDPAQDELMVSRLAYLRVKWTSLPRAYERFLADRLQDGAPVLLVDDGSRWPVTRVSERHVFQTGGRGGPTAQGHLAHPHAPEADDEAAEAEWGAGPGFADAVRDWCAAHGHPCVTIRLDGPQEAAHPVAQVLREWTRDRGGAADRLIVPSFVLGDPWRTIETGRTPFWTFFPVRSALQSLDAHLAATEPYRVVDLMLFQHGVDSPGVMTPREAVDVVRAHGAFPRLLALDPRRSPMDLGSLGRYGPALERDRALPIPFLPLTPARAVAGLTRVVGEQGRTVVDPQDALG